MKRIIFYFLLFTSTFSTGQPIYTVPWATQQPKFVFPMYFEEATGMRDTIYICYDPMAHTSQINFEDSAFGQIFRYVDTTKFYAYIINDDFCNSAPLQCDSQFKSQISSLTSQLTFPAGNQVFFRNGLLPLRITWDVSSLYSDSLPFVTTPGLPYAQGSITVNSSSPFIRVSENGNWWPTGTHFPILISDTGINNLIDSCAAFDINGGGLVEDFYFSIHFEKWTGFIPMGIIDESKTEFKIYPNPCLNELFLEFNKIITSPALVKIFDLSGKQVYSRTFNENIKLIPVSFDLNDGLYLINFNNSHFNFRKLIVISK